MLETYQGTSPLVFTILGFCEAHKISRTHLHEISRAGRGPKVMKVGRRVLISAEAAADWRKQMEQATQGAAQ